jgi:acetolactate synthase-1/2/3 large subunit
MGLGAYRVQRQFVGMPGMHGTYEANMAMQHCDVLIAIGARFDDRVIGNPKHFASNARKIIHIDIDPSSISKRVKVDIPSSATSRTCCRTALPARCGRARPNGAALDAWWQINEWRGVTA